MNPKILFVIGCMTNGGAERVVSVLANSLVKKYDISILQIYRDLVEYELDGKVNVFSIQNKTSGKFYRIHNRFTQIREQVKIMNPDLIISFIAEENIYTLLSLRNKTCPIVISERNDPKRSPESFLIRKLRDLVYRRADAMVFQTEDAKKYFESTLYKRIYKTIIANPVKENLPYHAKTSKGTRFISACRLYKKKNIHMMLEAMQILKDRGVECTLDIYGEGPLREEINKDIEQRGLTNCIHLNHFIKDIHREMASSSSFIITSNYEGISNSMIEALCIGTPVIATDCPVGGARMYIKNGYNGFLIKCRDSIELADKMQIIAENPELGKQIGEKATELRCKLDADIVTNQWVELINKMLKF